MKNLFALLTISTLVIIFDTTSIFAQRPVLGTADNYVLFTGAGALGSTGISQVIGNIGTNAGAITGFELPTTLIGRIDSINAATAQGAIDVQAAYNQLFNMVPTNTAHTPAFGTGETLFPGVYSIGGAGSVAGTLMLDAQGDPNALFIFQFGGAFTTAAATTIILINGALACNVFWAAEGAIAMAAVTTMKGTVIANNGAISMGAGGNLEGRMLSTTGAASIYSDAITLPVGCGFVFLPVKLISFTGICDKQTTLLNWITATETNNDYFTVERSLTGVNWQIVGTLAGSGNTSTNQSYALTDIAPEKKYSYYRLKQTDLDGKYEYGKVIYVKSCGADAASILAIYPNPSNGKFELRFAGNTNEVSSIEIINSQGQKVYRSTGFQSKFDLLKRTPGMYFMKVQQNSKTSILQIVIK